jgi:hypothetical protein
MTLAHDLRGLRPRNKRRHAALRDLRRAVELERTVTGRQR